MNQSQLAYRLGLNRTSITNMELGNQRIRLDQIEDMCRFFDCSPKTFLKGIWFHRD